MGIIWTSYIYEFKEINNVLSLLFRERVYYTANMKQKFLFYDTTLLRYCR